MRPLLSLLSLVHPILPYVTPETVKSSGCLRYRHLELSHKHFLLRFYKNKQKEKSVVGFGSITSDRGGVLLLLKEEQKN